MIFQIFAKNSFEFFVAKIFFKGQGKLFLTSQWSKAPLCDKKLRSLDPPEAPQVGYPIYGDFSICYFSTDFVRALKVGKNGFSLSLKNQSPFPVWHFYFIKTEL
ncbi:hypothetical protein CSUIS_1541 [Campylobacter porcelli]|uniref:Uncharacterized protein n=1 Tax=Campylobacter porcelli TaxID=1660073 RepID=A0A1X9SYN8_9BACT|nr:hypothetical protein CSUIS_1541 [Campylobacter sp. RM6137]